MKIKTCFYLLWQLGIILILFIFVSLDCRYRFRPTLNWFNIWLLLSAISQIKLVTSQHFFVKNVSLGQASLKKLKAENHQSQYQHHYLTNREKIHNELMFEDIKRRDDQLGIVLTLATSLLKALLGPLILLIQLTIDKTRHSFK
ncbi:MAG: hypothetical protein LKF37_13475 [Lentilactobacillus diolivorans]|nr:hypothetical protein [Lentilactobacillus diolivorans]RRG03798.1 MAG: hypothetical protein DUD34_02590 [Lactobacillus sp.]